MSWPHLPCQLWVLWWFSPQLLLFGTTWSVVKNPNAWTPLQTCQVRISVRLINAPRGLQCATKVDHHCCRDFCCVSWESSGHRQASLKGGFQIQQHHSHPGTWPKQMPPPKIWVPKTGQGLKVTGVLVDLDTGGGGTKLRQSLIVSTSPDDSKVFQVCDPLYWRIESRPKALLTDLHFSKAWLTYISFVQCAEANSLRMLGLPGYPHSGHTLLHPQCELCVL